MEFQNIKINDVNIIFDKEKTMNYRTEFNKPCDCQGCQNYYANLLANNELILFLNDFGIDVCHTEEVFYWDWTNDNDTLTHYEGYYGVFGEFSGEDFCIEKCGAKIKFSQNSEININTDKEEKYFWAIIEADFPYILDEEREITFNNTNEYCYVTDNKLPTGLLKLYKENGINIFNGKEK